MVSSPHLRLSIHLTFAEDDIRRDIVTSLVSMIKNDDKIASEAGRVLYECVRHSKSDNVLLRCLH
jgi:hypothetical protein